ncbi:hypothetical protein BLNAU_24471 [Blattamonas nauphoetae]|uniref:Uncharacterized protein n=1 Tax=Blattamonas nauphoetae TaxID=2049346 RepID=A0ABQ9WQ64_9EUKA|nr:hypothetical protein BLNAU_24471 [Blattamonas nauphoetae]
MNKSNPVECDQNHCPNHNQQTADIVKENKTTEADINSYSSPSKVLPVFDSILTDNSAPNRAYVDLDRDLAITTVGGAMHRHSPSVIHPEDYRFRSKPSLQK